MRGGATPAGWFYGLVRIKDSDSTSCAHFSSEKDTARSNNQLLAFKHTAILSIYGNFATSQLRPALTPAKNEFSPALGTGHLTPRRTRNTYQNDPGYMYADATTQFVAASMSWLQSSNAKHLVTQCTAKFGWDGKLAHCDLVEYVRFCHLQVLHIQRGTDPAHRTSPDLVRNM